MDSSTNAFISNTFNSLCIACNQQVENTPTVSIHDLLPHIQPAKTFFEGLQQLSDFSKFSIDQVPQRGCKTCFLKTSGCLRYKSLCNTSVYNIEAYILHQEETKHNLIDTDMTEASEACLNSFDDETYMIEVVESMIEPIVSIDIKENHQPQQSEITATDNSIIDNNNKLAADRRHILVNRTKEKTNEEKKQNKVECKHCHKWFTKNYIRYHERIHTGGEFYRCKICDKAFTNPGNYYSHMHHCHRTDIPPFLCNQCGRGFKRGWILQHHIKVKHNMERPYGCKVCGKTFTKSTTLKEHETTHSDERPFQCEKCPKRFSLKKLLRQHSVTHAEVRPIACEFCDKRFTQRHCLRSHQAKTCEGLQRT